ncbi:amidase [Microbacterium tumbae]
MGEHLEEELIATRVRERFRRMVEGADLNAVVTRAESSASASAAALDRDPDRAGALRGMTIGVKDNIDTAGIRTTAGSRVFAGNVPAVDAFAVERIRAEDGIIVAKLNMGEFALGGTTQNTPWGACRNPWDPRRIPGGSSGGSGAAVATGMVDASLATDTGGSIRVPAAANGVLGLRPTRGRISVRGILPLSPSLDTVGPLARDAGTLARVFDAIDRFDRRDPLSVDGPRVPLAPGLSRGVAGMRIGLATGYFADRVDAGAAEALAGLLPILDEAGCTIVPVEIGGAEEARRHLSSILFAESAVVHAGRLAGEDDDLLVSGTPERLRRGAGVGAADVVRAISWRHGWQRRIETLLDTVDVVLTPTMPCDVPLAVEEAGDIDRFAHVWAMFSGPTLSIPCGFHPVSGMPVGAQLTAAPWREHLLLRLAQAVQVRTGWHRRRPEGGRASAPRDVVGAAGHSPEGPDPLR